MGSSRPPRGARPWVKVQRRVVKAYSAPAAQKTDIGIVDAESQIRKNTGQQWATQQEMSVEAYPYLSDKKMDDTMQIKAVASDLANQKQFTSVCEKRRKDRVCDVNETLQLDNALRYAVSSGTVQNVKDRNRIYHVEYEQQYTPTNLQNGGEIQIDPADVPCQGFNLLLERNYVGMLSVFRKRVETEVLKHYKDETIKKHVKTAIASLLNADLNNSHPGEPDISHTNTSDYVIYTCSSIFKEVVDAATMVRIRRRMVVASLRFSDPPINIPLAEEFFIETLSKSQDAAFDNQDAPFTTDRSSVVLNFTLVSDAQVHADSPSQAKCNASTINFFGKNAFSLLVEKYTPASKSHFSTGHEAAMYMMGWLIRQLGSAASTVAEEKGSLGKLKTNSVFGNIVHEHNNNAKFVAEQNAKSFITKMGKKNFYTKTWLVSQSLAVIAITHAEQTAKSIVMVWSGGRLITDGKLFPRPANVSVRLPPMDAAPAPAGKDNGGFQEDSVPVLTRGASTRLLPSGSLVKPRGDDQFPGSKYTTSLPLHLERELQSL